MENIGNIIIKMTKAPQSCHDIAHFLKVYAYAKTIGEKELPDKASRDVLEAAAVLHDIACPYCREKYGHAPGPLQEQEGMPLTEAFLAEFKLPRDFTERVVWLVGHHHTVTDVTLPEHRILLEADFLVNADESQYSREAILAAEKSFFRTATGISLLHSIFLRDA